MRLYQNSTELYKKNANTFVVICIWFCYSFVRTELITLANKIQWPMNILYTTHKPTSVRNKPGYIKTAAGLVS